MRKRKQQMPSRRQLSHSLLSGPGCTSSAAEAGNSDTTARSTSGNNAGIEALIQQPEPEALVQEPEALAQEPDALVQQPEALIQQQFAENLDKCQFYLKVVPRQRARRELHVFEIVRFTITPVPGTEASLSTPVDELLDCEEFWLYIGSGSQSSMVYFEKGQMVGAGKKAKRKVEKLGFWFVDVDLPQPCVEALHSSLSQTLPLVLEEINMETRTMVVSVQATELVVPKIPFPSHPTTKKAANSAFMMFMEYIYEHRPPFDFTGLESTRKHDMDTFYEELQQCQEKVEVTVDVQHKSMLPRLRPYQRQAVQWMLDREKEDCQTKEELHPLYTEVVLKSGRTVYYNAVSGIASLERPTPSVAVKGGILADEMGLGKTLEVLTVMLLHPRPPLRPSSPLPITELPEEDDPKQNEVAEEAATAVEEAEKKPKRRRRRSKKSSQKEEEEKTAEEEVSPRPSTSTCPDSGANSQSSGTGTKRRKRKGRVSDAAEDDVAPGAPSSSSSDKTEGPTPRKRRKKTSRGKDEVTTTLDSKEGTAEASTGAQLESSVSSRTSVTEASEMVEVEANTVGKELETEEASSVAHVAMSCDDSDIPLGRKEDSGFDEETAGSSTASSDRTCSGRESVYESQSQSSQNAVMAVSSDHSYTKTNLSFNTDVEMSQPSTSPEEMETESPQGERASLDRSDMAVFSETLEDKSRSTSSSDSVEKRKSLDSSSDQESATSRTGESRTFSDIGELPVGGDWNNIKTEPEVVPSLGGIWSAFHTTDAFECLCGKGLDDGPRSLPVKCNNCGLRQHATCVNYDLSDPHRGHYLCPHCHYHTPPIPSKATLIISPESICYQWAEEIRKHIKQSSLNVLIYEGVGGGKGYIQPQKLASQDVVITTYEMLSKEINFVDLPHSSSQQGRRFRQPKRFMATPSPIVAVEWWRVCLDEAQMVECTTTKSAEMARRLSAVHRWCVTGTPIQKSLEDLFGLMAFLGTDPYCMQMWFRKLLFEPYCHGIRQPLYRALSGVLRRTAKKDVLDQIGLPGQKEELHLLTFSPVEAHFYARKYDNIRTEALRLLQRLPDQNATLHSLDRKTLSKVLHPLRTLRQACCHPQAVRGEFLSLHKQTMTMEQLLESLVAKTKLECLEAHRSTVFCINGIAGIHIVCGEYVSAAEEYRKVLWLIKEKQDLGMRTDDLQQLHTKYNLHWVLTNHPHGIPPTLRDSQLPEECEEHKVRFLAEFAANVQKQLDILQQRVEAVSQLQNKMQEAGQVWWMEVLGLIGLRDNGEEELLRRISQDLFNIRFSVSLRPILKCRNLDGLMLAITQQLKNLDEARDEAMMGVMGLKRPPTPAMVQSAAVCCVRNVTGHKANMCQYCYVVRLLEDCEGHLFRREKELSKRGMSTSTSALEETLKTILAFGHRLRASREVLETGACHLKLLEAMRKVQLALEAVWKEMHFEVGAFDALEQAMMRMRLRETWESTQDGVRVNVLGSLIEAEAHKDSLLLTKATVERDFLKAHGRLRYLEQLSKRSEVLSGGDESTEQCPICQNTLGVKWCVLQCCHAVCLACLDQLMRQSPLAQRVRCAMCRDSTPHIELAYVSMKSEEDAPSVHVKGSSSTKITSVVRTLLQIKLEDPQAKSLVFSKWPDMLELIGVALKENDFNFRSLANSPPKKFQANLKAFREEDDVNILLIPVATGARGLNLTQATHVLLVEPLLDSSIELQAVSRVHRIGQIRETFVHRFVVQGTIEERIYKLSSNAKPSASQPTSESENLRIEDLVNLYGRSEVTSEDGNEEGQDLEPSGLDPSAGVGYRLGS